MTLPPGTVTTTPWIRAPPTRRPFFHRRLRFCEGAGEDMVKYREIDFIDFLITCMPRSNNALPARRAAASQVLVLQCSPVTIHKQPDIPIFSSCSCFLQGLGEEEWFLGQLGSVYEFRQCESNHSCVFLTTDRTLASHGRFTLVVQ
jgi:hypothetical protein